MSSRTEKIHQKIRRRLLLGGIVIAILATALIIEGVAYLDARQDNKDRALIMAEQGLSMTAQRIESFLLEVEEATNGLRPLVLANMKPDSLMEYAHRMTVEHPNFNGCSITTEPNYFPQYGRYFSVYSLRLADSVKTVREGPYEYYEKVWYKMPSTLGRGCWTDPYDDYNTGTLYSTDMIASYGLPLYNQKSELIGVISTDLSLPRLSKIITERNPYETSYCFMLGKDGHYFVHPDSTRLFTRTIFEGIDSLAHPDIYALGHEMLEGKSGQMDVVINDTDHIVLYKPLKRAGWSIALVCPKDRLTEDF